MNSVTLGQRFVRATMSVCKAVVFCLIVLSSDRTVSTFSENEGLLKDWVESDAGRLEAGGVAAVVDMGVEEPCGSETYGWEEGGL